MLNKHLRDMFELDGDPIGAVTDEMNVLTKLKGVSVYRAAGNIARSSGLSDPTQIAELLATEGYTETPNPKKLYYHIIAREIAKIYGAR